MIERTGAEGGKEDRWRGLLHDFRMLMRGLEQHFFNLIQVGTIGHAKADDHAGDGVG